MKTPRTTRWHGSATALLLATSWAALATGDVPLPRAMTDADATASSAALLALDLFPAATDPTATPQLPAGLPAVLPAARAAAPVVARPAALPGATTGTIPSAALAAYQRAETIIGAADAACRLDWQLLAAVGRVESDHGRAGGGALDADGVARPSIIGVRLDGSGDVARIDDTEGGALDGDRRFDRAVGPMQFLPSTWSVVGVDADGDDARDPQDVDDAALAAAVYLCSGEDDLATEQGRRAAVFRYNHSESYVALVLGLRDDYLADGPSATPDLALALPALPPLPAPPSSRPAPDGAPDSAVSSRDRSGRDTAAPAPGRTSGRTPGRTSSGTPGRTPGRAPSGAPDASREPGAGSGPTGSPGADQPPRSPQPPVPSQPPGPTGSPTGEPPSPPEQPAVDGPPTSTPAPDPDPEPDPEPGTDPAPDPEPGTDPAPDPDTGEVPAVCATPPPGADASDEGAAPTGGDEGECLPPCPAGPATDDPAADGLVVVDEATDPVSGTPCAVLGPPDATAPTTPS